MKHFLLFFPLYLALSLLLIRVLGEAAICLRTALDSHIIEDIIDTLGLGSLIPKPPWTGKVPNMSEYILIQQETGKLLYAHGAGLKTISRRLCKIHKGLTHRPPKEEHIIFIPKFLLRLSRVRSLVGQLADHLIAMVACLLRPNAKVAEYLHNFACGAGSNSSSPDSLQCLVIRQTMAPNVMVTEAGSKLALTLALMERALLNRPEGIFTEPLSDNVPMRVTLFTALQEAKGELERLEQLFWARIHISPIISHRAVCPKEFTDCIPHMSPSSNNPNTQTSAAGHPLSLALCNMAGLSAFETVILATLEDLRGFLNATQNYIEYIFAEVHSVRLRAALMDHRPIRLSGLVDFEAYLLESQSMIFHTVDCLVDAIHNADPAYYEQGEDCWWTGDHERKDESASLSIADHGEEWQ